MGHAAIVLASGDNVGVVTSDVRPGSDLLANERRLTIVDPIPFGHKVAIVPIAAGDRIVKFGVPIGQATMAIAPGEHVHMHNIESTYINNAIDHYET